MLLSLRPLSAADTDAPLAIDSRRAVAQTIARNVGRGRNTLLLGRRGSGRTSTLNLVAADLRRRGADARVVDVGGWRRGEDVVDVVLAALGSDPRGPITRTVRWQDQLGLLGSREEIVAPRPLNETDVAAIAEAARNLGGSPVVLLDNLAPGPAHDLFGRFRDTLWSAPVVWVAAGDGDRDGYLEPPADSFWDVVTWLEPLRADEVSELIERRMRAAAPKDPDVAPLRRALRQLVALLDQSTPREVIRAAAQVVDEGGVSGVEGSSERFGAADRAGGRSAAMLLAEMERLGRPVHAGDEELLGRMGISRPRIVQLLGKLEDAGLLESRREGRRILYRPRP